MKKLINIPFGSPMISKKDKEQVLDVLNGHMLTHGPKCEQRALNLLQESGESRL